MKKYIYAGLLLLTLGSCSDFLDTVPTDFITPKNYFKTESDINTALTGIYDILGKTGTYGRTMYFELDTSDEGFNGLSQQTIDLSLNNYDASDVKVYNLWTLLYDGINRANIFLENIDNSDIQMSEEKIRIAKGEAMFLRAYYYFLLVTNWGDVPLKLESTKSVYDVNIERTSAEIVYNRVISDMEDAYDMVPRATVYRYNSRITKSTVAGILARVNLKMAGFPLNKTERFAEARKWALEVMNPENGHELNPDYKQVFINHCQDIYDTKECIWEVEFGKVDTGGQEEEGSLGSISGIGNSDRTFGYSYGAMHATERYYRLFGEGDLRRDWTINDYYYGVVNGVPNTHVPYSDAQIYNRSNAKWRREYETATPKNVGTTPINFPILRYSDVLLMFAEAENEVNGPTEAAFEAVNKVRRRAYGLNLPEQQVNPVDAEIRAEVELPENLDQADFRIAIQKERSLELGFEALRRFDLIRWGIYLSTMRDLSNEIKNSAPATYKFAGRAAENTSERHLLLPIPSLEMALNKLMKQNPDW